jgi:antitoxin MazE
MRVRIVKIGNSQGIRIPKPVLEQTRLRDEVEIKVKDEQIVLSPVLEPRAGWAEAFREMAHHGDDEMLDAPLPSLSNWDVDEWEW